LTPGGGRVRLCPHPSSLTACDGKIPTPRGPIKVSWRHGPSFLFTVEVPVGMPVCLALPLVGAGKVSVDGHEVETIQCGDRLPVSGHWSGRHQAESPSL
jgi:hypothetical protein